MLPTKEAVLIGTVFLSQRILLRCEFQFVPIFGRVRRHGRGLMVMHKQDFAWFSGNPACQVEARVFQLRLVNRHGRLSIPLYNPSCTVFRKPGNSRKCFQESLRIGCSCLNTNKITMFPVP